MTLNELTFAPPAAWSPHLHRLLPSTGSVVAADRVSRSFGARRALDDVSLQVEAGEIHALLGPNGAGKTTLLRILSGLTTPDAGSVRVLGVDAVDASRRVRQAMGLVPSGDRTFYLRVSGLENLVFFARLYGLRRREALARARVLLELVGLADAERERVGHYSHGMQKRLSVARALLTQPAVLLVDEATHDLDPQGATDVRELVQQIAFSGAAVVWTTQRVDEIRGFADRVTLLRRGTRCFVGTVPELIALTEPRHFLLRLRRETGPALSAFELEHVLGPSVQVKKLADGHYGITLVEGIVLGDVVTSLGSAAIDVLSCSQERSEIEEAFLRLTGDGAD